MTFRLNIPDLRRGGNFYSSLFYSSPLNATVNKKFGFMLLW